MERNTNAISVQSSVTERTYTIPEIAEILKIKTRTAYALCSHNPPLPGHSYRPERAGEKGVLRPLV